VEILLTHDADVHVVNVSDVGALVFVLGLSEAFMRSCGVDDWQRYGHTPLFFAARDGRAAIVEALVAHGAIVNGTVAHGATVSRTVSLCGALGCRVGDRFF
jgi:hypothetical protein